MFASSPRIPKSGSFYTENTDLIGDFFILFSRQLSPRPSQLRRQSLLRVQGSATISLLRENSGPRENVD